jgi:hypothetical protein
VADSSTPACTPAQKEQMAGSQKHNQAAFCRGKCKSNNVWHTNLIQLPPQQGCACLMGGAGRVQLQGQCIKFSACSRTRLPSGAAAAAGRQMGKHLGTCVHRWLEDRMISPSTKLAGGSQAACQDVRRRHLTLPGHLESVPQPPSPNRVCQNVGNPAQARQHTQQGRIADGNDER